MKDLIKEKGLWGYVSKDGEEVVERMKKESEGQLTIQDPLMAGCTTFMSYAVDCGGVYLLGSNPEGGHYCPLCEAEKYGGGGTAEDWMNSFYTQMEEDFRKKGLIGN